MQLDFCLLQLLNALLLLLLHTFKKSLFFFCKAAFQQIVSWDWFIPDAGFCISFFELHEVSFRPFLQPTEVTLNSIVTLEHINWSFSVCKLSKSLLCPIVPIFNEGVEQYWSQDLPRGTLLIVSCCLGFGSWALFESGRPACFQFISYSTYLIHVSPIWLQSQKSKK